jgi:hypothetical protein
MEPEEQELDGRSKNDVCLEMALEYFYYNIKSTWTGENTPILITTNIY